MLRIIAGEFKGRRLKAPAGRTVRPTGDRVKEAWFSILQQSIPDARVLDLFAGSGALGFEALSRGAVSVDFVETSKASLAAIRDNATTLNVGDRVTIHRSDALRFAERLQPAQYDVAFADPPYASAAAAQLVELYGLIPFARVFSIEHSADLGIVVGDTRRYGDTAITILQSPPMKRIAVYPGSFDPITKGHEDLIHRSLQFVDQLIVAVAVNVAKQPLFSLDERVALIKQAIPDKRLEVQSFEGLLAEFAKKVGASVIIRGLRAVSDFEYEFQMALMNRNLAPRIETVFLVPAFDLTFVSSSLVREVARFGGDVSPLVDPTVQQALKRKFSK